MILRENIRRNVENDIREENQLRSPPQLMETYIHVLHFLEYFGPRNTSYKV